MLTAQGVEAQSWEAALAGASLQKHSEWHWKLEPENMAKLTDLWSGWIKFACQAVDDEWPLPTARSKQREKEERWLRSIGREATQASGPTEAPACPERRDAASQIESPDTRAERKPPARAGPGEGRETLWRQTSGRADRRYQTPVLQSQHRSRVRSGASPTDTGYTLEGTGCQRAHRGPRLPRAP